MKKSNEEIKSFRMWVCFTTLIIFIMFQYACDNVGPKGRYELTQSSCVREVNTTSCPDSSLFHMLAKGKAFGPVGTYVVFGSDRADSVVLDCGSWTFNTDGRVYGCYRESNQNEETEFVWRGYYLLCLPNNSFWNSIEYFIVINTSLEAPYYLVEDNRKHVSCMP